MKTSLKNTTVDDSLILYAELNDAEIRAAQRHLKTGLFKRIVSGVFSASPEKEWPAIIALHRIRLLAALFPGAVIGYRSAFSGGMPVDGVMHLSYSYKRVVDLPGLQVVLVKGHGNVQGDQPMSGRNLFFPSQASACYMNSSEPFSEQKVPHSPLQQDRHWPQAHRLTLGVWHFLKCWPPHCEQCLSCKNLHQPQP
jgi:hypothetical protein